MGVWRKSRISASTTPNPEHAITWLIISRASTRLTKEFNWVSLPVTSLICAFNNFIFNRLPTTFPILVILGEHLRLSKLSIRLVCVSMSLWCRCLQRKRLWMRGTGFHRRAGGTRFPSLCLTLRRCVSVFRDPSLRITLLHLMKCFVECVREGWSRHSETSNGRRLLCHVRFGFARFVSLESVNAWMETNPSEWWWKEELERGQGVAFYVYVC